MLNKYQLAWSTGYAALNQKQVPLNVDLNNFQTLGSNRIHTHVSSHSLAFENTTRGGSSAYRTWRTMPIGLSMSLWPTFKSMALNASCKSSTLGCTSDSNHVARLENGHINPLTNLNTVEICWRKLPKISKFS